MKSIFRPEINLENMKASFQKGGSSESFGIKFIEMGEKTISATLTVDDQHLRPGGIANGGVYLMLLETVGSVASSCVIDFKTQNTLGVGVTANHLKSSKKGDQLTSIASPVHLGRSTHVWEVNTFNQRKELISTGRITMMIISK